MYCKNCGKEIHDEAVMCVHCGVPTDNMMKGKRNNVDSASPANGGLIVLSVLIPLVGIILGIVNISQGKKHAGNVYLWTGIIVWLTCTIILSVSMLL